MLKLSQPNTEPVSYTHLVHAEQLGNPVVSNEAIEIPFNVIVEEGRHYKLGSIHLPSSEPLAMAEINITNGVVSNPTEKMPAKDGVTLRTTLAYVTGQYKSCLLYTSRCV